MAAAKEAGVRIRYIVLTAMCFILLALVMNNTTFQKFGPVLYLIFLTLAVFVLAIMMRRILNRKTTDAYVHSGQFDKDFMAMPSNHRVWMTFIQFLVYIFVIAMIAGHVMGGTPDFAQTKVRPEWSARLDKVAYGISRDSNRYLAIQKMRPNGMPWFVVGGIHERESSRNFLRHLHEGSSLQSRTAYVPKGRPLQPNPPYTFEQSAEDALYVLKREHYVNWQNTQDMLDAIEKYNGLGYRNYHPTVPSPYLWSGSTYYTRGKYVADGRFSSLAIDQQVGVATLLVHAKSRGLL